MKDFNPCAFQQIKAVGYAVKIGKHHSFNSGLNYEFGTFHAGTCRYIKSTPLARVVASRHFGYGVSLSMQHVRISGTLLGFTHVRKTGRCPVIAVGNYHLVLYEQSSHLSANTVRVLRPYRGHPQVPAVQQFLFSIIKDR